MKESHSRLLLALESVFFLAPLTALTLAYSVLLVSLYLNGFANEPLGTHVTPAFTFAGVMLQGFGWWAVGSFVFRGRQGLTSLGPVTRGAMCTGAVLATLGAASTLASFLLEEWPLLGALGVNVFGVPALVPFAHIAVELRRSAANNSSKPTPLRGAA